MSSTMLRGIGVLLLFVAGGWCAETCPPKVKEVASQCVGPYMDYYDSVTSTRGRLYSGIDAEEMRQLCSQFDRFTSCYNRLKSACPRGAHPTIDEELQGVVDISAICRADDFYGHYAMSHFCFLANKRESDRCYDEYTSNTTAFVNEAYKGSNYAARVICRSGDRTKECIAKNIRDHCGQQAAKLVETLVTPILKMGDVQCDMLDAQVTTSAPVTISVRDTQKLHARNGQDNISHHRSLVLLALFTVWRTIT